MIEFTIDSDHQRDWGISYCSITLASVKNKRTLISNSTFKLEFLENASFIPDIQILSKLTLSLFCIINFINSSFDTAEII